MPRIIIRGGQSAEEHDDVVLAAGEPAAERDTGVLKIGDGSSTWDELPVANDDAIAAAVAAEAVIRAAADTALDLRVDALEADDAGDDTAIALVQTNLDNHIADTSDAHDASAISIADVANDFTATDVEGALAELQAADEADEAALAAHLADTSDAHDASAISIVDAAGDFTATDVEGALAELQADHEADATALTDHISDATAAHAASAISYNGGTGMSATDVEAAIGELATEKLDTVTAASTYAPRVDGVPVGLHTHLMTRSSAPNNISDGTTFQATAQLAHSVIVDCRSIRLVYTNNYNSSGTVTSNPNPITVKASVQQPASTFHPVFFNGKRSVVIEPGASAISDPIGLFVEAGTILYSRTLVSVASGEVWPLGLTTRTASSEGVSSSDIVDSGAMGATATKCYGPTIVVGQPADPLGSPTVAIWSDSNGAGFGETTEDAGWVVRALDNELPYLNLSVSGTTASLSDTPAERRRRQMVADYVRPNVAIVALGTNDLTGGGTSAQVQARLQDIFDDMAAQGMEVWGATIPPVTTSSDGWATTVNQTVVASNTDRIAVNTWLRTVPAPLAGVLEFADAVESARDSGIWKAAHTADGTHANAAGYTEMAAAVDPSDFGPTL